MKPFEQPRERFCTVSPPCFRSHPSSDIRLNGHVDQNAMSLPRRFLRNSIHSGMNDLLSEMVHQAGYPVQGRWQVMEREGGGSTRKGIGSGAFRNVCHPRNPVPAQESVSDTEAKTGVRTPLVRGNTVSMGTATIGPLVLVTPTPDGASCPG